MNSHLPNLIFWELKPKRINETKKNSEKNAPGS